MIEFYDHKNQASGEETGHKISFQVHHFHPPYQEWGQITEECWYLIIKQSTTQTIDQQQTDIIIHSLITQELGKFGQNI